MIISSLYKSVILASTMVGLGRAVELSGHWNSRNAHDIAFLQASDGHNRAGRRSRQDSADSNPTPTAQCFGLRAALNRCISTNKEILGAVAGITTFMIGGSILWSKLGSDYTCNAGIVVDVGSSGTRSYLISGLETKQSIQVEEIFKGMKKAKQVQ